MKNLRLHGMILLSSEFIKNFEMIGGRKIDTFTYHSMGVGTNFISDFVLHV